MQKRWFVYDGTHQKDSNESWEKWLKKGGRGQWAKSSPLSAKRKGERKAEKSKFQKTSDPLFLTSRESKRTHNLM